MDVLSDTALMLKVQNGHLETLGLLFERYKKLLYSFFYQMTSNSALSEDMVQNVFYRIIKYRSQFKGTGSFKAWMFAVARNVMADEFRKKGIKHYEPVEKHYESIIAEGSASTSLEAVERKTLLHQALNKLDADKKELVVLVKLNEMKYKEVAEMLNMNESTVKVKVFRALKELQNIYQHSEK